MAIVIVLGIAVIGCNQSNLEVKSDMQSFLPLKIQAWTKADTIATYDRESIFEYINGAGEIFLAYDFRRVEVSTFLRPEFPDITVEMFDMGSSEEAYGIFSHSREAEETGIGAGYEYRAGLLCFWQNRYFVCVRGSASKAECEETILELAKAISSQLPSESTAPHNVGYLADTGLVKTSIRYFHAHTSLNVHYYLSSDNFLGLSRYTRCVLAHYAPDSALVLCVEYPSVAEAEAAVGGLLSTLAPWPELNESKETAEHGWVASRLREQFLILVLKGSDEVRATQLAAACEQQIGESLSRSVAP